MQVHIYEIPKINGEPGLNLLDRIGSDIVQSSLNELFRNDFVRLYEKSENFPSKNLPAKSADTSKKTYAFVSQNPKNLSALVPKITTQLQESLL